MKFRQPRAKFIGVEIGDPKVIMIDSCGLTVALLNAKEGLPYAEDMNEISAAWNVPGRSSNTGVRHA
jgi:hypothetical protein